MRDPLNERLEELEKKFARDEHDEAMRMQALAIAVQAVRETIPLSHKADWFKLTTHDVNLARDVYREATGRDW